MSENSKIEWTATVNADGTMMPGATWNPIRARRLDTGKVGWHCEKVSSACDNCYAAAMNKRSDGLVGIGTGLNYAPDSFPKVEIYLDEKTLLAPLWWKRPRKIFVCSMTDLFGDWVTDDMIDRIFAVIALCPQHTFQVLTKRPERALAWSQGIDDNHGGWLDGECYRDSLIEGEAQNIYSRLNPGADPSEWLALHQPLPNVWLGVTAENQEQADKRIPLLLDTPAAVRFLSAEPLLGALDVRPYFGWTGKNSGLPSPLSGALASLSDLPGLDWVITGGESGRKARPSHPEWFKGLRDQCQAAGVPFFFKQWGEWVPTDQTRFQDGVEHRLFPDGDLMPWADFEIGPWGNDDAEEVVKIGKKAAGRLLDGREWSDFPEVAQ